MSRALVYLLNKKLNIFDLIDAQEGEIFPDQEKLIEKIEKDISENLIEFCEFYKSFKQAELQNRERYLEIKNHLETTKNKIDSALLPLLDKTGRIKNQFCSIGNVEKETESLEIIDFDRTAESFPTAVSITTNTDNTERTMRISKTTIKELIKTQGYDDETLSALGVLKKTNKSKYVDVRLK